jgi:DnaJ-class molecular chaperone
MNAMTQKIKEHTCAACNGTGFPVVKQPALATHKIYPMKCEACAGKGRITDVELIRRK